MSTEAERRLAFEQALASARIEGYVPTSEYLADCEAVIEGRMTYEQAIAAGIRRVLKEHGLTAESDAVADADTAGHERMKR